MRDLSRSVRTARQTVGLPLAAFLTAQLIIIGAAWASSVNPLRAATYARWDSHNYLSIATRGYYVELEGNRVVGGNVAWFPGYSLAIRGLASRRFTPAKAGKLISTVFAFALLVILWRVLSGLEAAPRPALSLWMGALFPGFIYDHAVFPTSMVSCFILLALVLCARGRYLWAGCAGALAAVTYSTGFLVAAPLALGILLDRGLTKAGKVVALMKGPLVVALGVAAVFVYQGETVGWGAFTRMQREYFGNAPSNPLATLAWNTAHLWRGELRLEHLPQAQTLMVAALMAIGCGLYWRRRRVATAIDTLLLADALVYWSFPQLVGRGVSASRAEALLIVLVPLLARLPVGGQALLLALFVPVGLGMCVLFFEAVLV